MADESKTVKWKKGLHQCVHYVLTLVALVTAKSYGAAGQKSTSVTAAYSLYVMGCCIPEKEKNVRSHYTQQPLRTIQVRRDS